MNEKEMKPSRYKRKYDKQESEERYVVQVY